MGTQTRSGSCWVRCTARRCVNTREVLPFIRLTPLWFTLTKRLPPMDDRRWQLRMMRCAALVQVCEPEREPATGDAQTELEWLLAKSAEEEEGGDVVPGELPWPRHLFVNRSSEPARGKIHRVDPKVAS